MKYVVQEWLRVTTLLFIAQAVSAMVLPNATLLEELLEKYMDEDGEWWIAKQRGKRAITDSDMQSILDLHNKLRGQVYPPASNMEYMPWAKGFCHGPANLLPSIGQNLGAHWGRYRPPTFHVQAWYDEVRDFTYPHPHECDPYCPYKCSGPVCTHYTQVCVQQTRCSSGNWWGHAPYKPGRPCSACPPSFGGGCRENLCYREDSERPYSPHEPEEETNEIERQRSKAQDATAQSRPRTHPPPGSTGTDDSEKNEVISTQQMSQIVSCEVRLRDQCKGTTCNRYECPAGCLDSKAKVIGSVHYEMQSSICKAAIHYGVLDNEGGWVDVTRQGRKNYFIKSYRNGVQSIGKYQSANSFTVSKVTVQAITCETTVEQLCPFQKPASHCPRVYCPRNCMQANPHYARVIGTRIYSDISSICRAAVHAGVVPNQGGYVDVMPVDKRKVYVASFQNGIYSERKQGIQSICCRLSLASEM
uniref:Cysteine rich secretory protein LCCL domain containing 1 n=1 Tax=Calidris pygmaea TaxID=425635 RepID=A0A8C3JFI8_9CHAR